MADKENSVDEKKVVASVKSVLSNKTVRIVVTAITAAGVGFLIAGGSTVAGINDLVKDVAIAVAAVASVISAILSN